MVLNVTAKKGRDKKSGVLSVEIDHTGCYGRCPTYNITITADGMAKYDAVMFNKDTGVFEKNIGKKKAKEILDYVSTNKLDTCKDKYRYVPDLPNINCTITYTTKVKNIENVKYAPPVLQALVKLVDDAGTKTDGNGWKKVNGPAGK